MTHEFGTMDIMSAPPIVIAILKVVCDGDIDNLCNVSGDGEGI
jgi:hypothetical protein